jgi:predicted ribosomally synthesized peptide with nif11-like leader
MPRGPAVQSNVWNAPLSTAQLIAFIAKAEADPALKQKLDAAGDASAVVAIARGYGFLFSPASLARHLRG